MRYFVVGVLAILLTIGSLFTMGSDSVQGKPKLVVKPNFSVGTKHLVRTAYGSSFEVTGTGDDGWIKVKFGAYILGTTTE